MRRSVRRPAGAVFGPTRRTTGKAEVPPAELRWRLRGRVMANERTPRKKRSPSPGTPGEGGGEGDLEDQVLATPAHRVRQVTLTLTLSRGTGRGDQSARGAA